MFAGSENVTEWFNDITYELLCGPVPIKTHADITDHCITLSLAHPRLLQCEQNPTILLCIQDLFVSQYLEVTEEATKGLTDKVAELDTPFSRRRLHNYMSRSRLLRKQQQQSTKPLLNDIHSSLQITVYPYKGTVSVSRREALLKCIFYEDLIVKLVLTVCDYSIEETEFCHLNENVYHKKKTNTREEVERRQSNALNILCWIISMAYCNGDR